MTGSPTAVTPDSIVWSPQDSEQVSNFDPYRQSMITSTNRGQVFGPKGDFGPSTYMRRKMSSLQDIPSHSLDDDTLARWFPAEYATRMRWRRHHAFLRREAEAAGKPAPAPLPFGPPAVPADVRITPDMSPKERQVIVDGQHYSYEAREAAAAALREAGIGKAWPYREPGYTVAPMERMMASAHVPASAWGLSDVERRNYFAGARYNGATSWAWRNVMKFVADEHKEKRETADVALNAAKGFAKQQHHIIADGGRFVDAFIAAGGGAAPAPIGVSRWAVQQALGAHTRAHERNVRMLATAFDDGIDARVMHRATSAEAAEAAADDASADGADTGYPSDGFVNVSDRGGASANQTRTAVALAAAGHRRATSAPPASATAGAAADAPRGGRVGARDVRGVVDVADTWASARGAGASSERARAASARSRRGLLRGAVPLGGNSGVGGGRSLDKEGLSAAAAGMRARLMNLPRVFQEAAQRVTPRGQYGNAFTDRGAMRYTGMGSVSPDQLAGEIASVDFATGRVYFDLPAGLAGDGSVALSDTLREELAADASRHAPHAHGIVTAGLRIAQGALRKSTNLLGGSMADLEHSFAIAQLTPATTVRPRSVPLAPIGTAAARVSRSLLSSSACATETVHVATARVSASALTGRRAGRTAVGGVLRKTTAALAAPQAAEPFAAAAEAEIAAAKAAKPLPKATGARAAATARDPDTVELPTFTARLRGLGLTRSECIDVSTATARATATDGSTTVDVLHLPTKLLLGLILFGDVFGARVERPMRAFLRLVAPQLDRAKPLSAEDFASDIASEKRSLSAEDRAFEEAGTVDGGTGEATAAAGAMQDYPYYTMKDMASERISGGEAIGAPEADAARDAARAAPAAGADAGAAGAAAAATASASGMKGASDSAAAEDEGTGWIGKRDRDPTTASPADEATASVDALQRTITRVRVGRGVRELGAFDSGLAYVPMLIALGAAAVGAGCMPTVAAAATAAAPLATGKLVGAIGVAAYLVRSNIRQDHVALKPLHAEVRGGARTAAGALAAAGLLTLYLEYAATTASALIPFGGAALAAGSVSAATSAALATAAAATTAGLLAVAAGWGLGRLAWVALSTLPAWTAHCHPAAFTGHAAGIEAAAAADALAAMSTDDPERASVAAAQAKARALQRRSQLTTAALYIAAALAFVVIGKILSSIADAALYEVRARTYAPPVVLATEPAAAAADLARASGDVEGVVGGRRVVKTPNGPAQVAVYLPSSDLPKFRDAGLLMRDDFVRTAAADPSLGMWVAASGTSSGTGQALLAAAAVMAVGGSVVSRRLRAVGTEVYSRAVARQLTRDVVDCRAALQPQVDDLAVFTATSVAAMRHASSIAARDADTLADEIISLRADVATLAQLAQRGAARDGGAVNSDASDATGAPASGGVLRGSDRRLSRSSNGSEASCGPAV